MDDSNSSLRFFLMGDMTKTAPDYFRNLISKMHDKWLSRGYDDAYVLVQASPSIREIFRSACLDVRAAHVNEPGKKEQLEKELMICVCKNDIVRYTLGTAPLPSLVP